MDKKKIYLAIPYANNRELSFHIASKIAADLILEGYMVFSPISHSHPIKRIGKLGCFGYKGWKEFDESMMDWCDSVWVVQLDGWKESIGVSEEIKYAKENGKEVFYIFEDSIYVEEAIGSYNIRGNII